MAIVSSDTSPAQLLARFRGPVTDTYPLYPERIGIEVRDTQGETWRLVTCDAEYSPSDPETLVGKTVESTALHEDGKLVVGFSDGTDFTATPVPDEEEDDIENWSLFMPERRVLVFGPHGRSRVVSATDPC
ncbi:MAG: hypothetical protein JST59_24480 [Actinobacteria bacterium]|nr:hypothetical protein [Actinomycetota bacterium]